MNKLKIRLHSLLRWSEKYFKTDMVYVTRSGFWISVSQGVAVLTGLGLSVAYANLIDPNTYGVFRYVLSFASILSIFALPGINTSYSQAVARGNEGNLQEVIKEKFTYGLVGSAIAVSISLYYLIKGGYILAGLFAVTAIFVPVWNLYNITDFHLQGKRLFRESAIYATVKAVITTFLIVVTLFATNNLVVLALVYFLSWSAVHYLVFKYIKKVFPANNNEESGIISYGKHLTTISVIPVISQYIDRIFVFHLLGPVQLAGYNFAVAMPDQIRSYTKNLQSVAAPVLAASRSDKIWFSIRHKVTVITSVFLFVTIVYVAAAPILFKTLFPQYTEFTRISQWYSLTIIFSASTLPFLALQAKEAKEALYKFNTIKSTFQITSLVLMLFLWGLPGAIGARILTEVLSLMLGMTLVRKNLN